MLERGHEPGTHTKNLQPPADEGFTRREFLLIGAVLVAGCAGVIETPGANLEILTPLAAPKPDSTEPIRIGPSRQEVMITGEVLEPKRTRKIIVMLPNGTKQELIRYVPFSSRFSYTTGPTPSPMPGRYHFVAVGDGVTSEPSDPVELFQRRPSAPHIENLQSPMKPDLLQREIPLDVRVAADIKNLLILRDGKQIHSITVKDTDVLQQISVKPSIDPLKSNLMAGVYEVIAVDEAGNRSEGNPEFSVEYDFPAFEIVEINCPPPQPPQPGGCEGGNQSYQKVLRVRARNALRCHVRVDDRLIGNPPVFSPQPGELNIDPASPNEGEVEFDVRTGTYSDVAYPLVIHVEGPSGVLRFDQEVYFKQS